jgi:hypothetical protein
MNVYQTEWLGEDESEGDDSVTSADVNDVFGAEEGGFCCFTHSVVMIYLRLWLNERPGLSGFTSQHIPDILQVDTITAPAAMSTTRQQTSSDMLAESINNLAKARKSDDGEKAMHESIAQFHISEAKKSEHGAKLEKINLLHTQIAVLTERMQRCSDEDKKLKYIKG